jgi:hypothetical protein
MRDEGIDDKSDKEEDKEEDEEGNEENVGTDEEEGFPKMLSSFAVRSC